MHATNTATMPVILFVLGLLALNLSDALLLSEPLPMREIRLDVAQTESMEAETLVGLEGEIKSKLMDDLFDAHQAGDNLLQQQAFIELSRDERSLVLRQMASRLVGAKSYTAMISLAESFSLDERLDKGIQFHYALALARHGQISSQQTSETGNLSDQAVSAYLALLANQPRHAAAAINLGLLLNRLQRYQEADVVLATAVQVSEGQRKAKALSAQASAAMKRNQLGRAEALFRQSIKYRPDHPITLVKLAELRARLEYPMQDVVASFEKAIDLSENRYRYQKKYGEYLLQRLAFERAAEVLYSALQESNKDDQIRRLLAWAMFESGQWLKSREHWKWLSTNAGSKKYRLLGEHMVLLIDQQERLLKEPDNQKDEFVYARALLADSDELYRDARQILGNIDANSPWFLRAQRRLDMLNAQMPGTLAIDQNSFNASAQQFSN